MSSIELQRYPNGDSLAAAVVEAWAVHRSQTVPGKPYTVALSGGRIARTLFQKARAYEPRFLEGVDFFWADERCVPPEDPESNFLPAYRELFEPLDLPERRIHRVRGEAPPQAARERAAREICEVAEVEGPHLPVLDLVLLGMGEDGHVASLFPGASAPSKDEEDLIYLAVRGPKPPPDRITLTYQTLSRAREAWVLASGPGKEEALARSLAGSGETPLGRLIGMRAMTRIFTDIG